MNKKSISKSILLSIMISISLLLSSLLIDHLYYNNRLFSFVSKNFYDYTNFQFGLFLFPYIFYLPLLTVLILIKIKPINKLTLIFGTLIGMLSINGFLEFINFKNYFFGNIFCVINNEIFNFNPIFKYLIYFTLFFVGLFCLLYPLREYIGKTILSIHGVILSSAGKSKFLETKKRDRTPFISKVVYENTGCRVEYPIFNSEARVKKFKLEKSSDTSQYYKEVDTFSNSKNNLNEAEIVEFDTKTLDKDEYFEKIKQNWPEHWRKNRLNRDENNLVIERLDTITLFNDELNKNRDKNTEDKENEEEIYELEVVDEFEEGEIKQKNSNKFLLLEGDSLASKDNRSGLLNRVNNIQNITNSSFIEDVEEHFLEDSIALEQTKNLDKYKDLQEFPKIPLSNREKNEGYSNEDSDIIDDYKLPQANILSKNLEIDISKFSGEERESAIILEQTLMEFGIKAEVCDIVHGPVVTLFKLVPSSGVKLSRIEGLSTNLALRLAAQSIRIIAPIPGESVVGIEIPNKVRELVSFKEVVNSKEFTESKYNIPIGLGKDIYGNIIVVDLYKMPHILIAGATGAGKSVCVNSFISSILFSKTPDDLRLLLIDPKIVELKPYNNIPHLLTPVITESKDAMIGLKYLLYEMERRYSLLDEMGVRDIVEYQKSQKTKKPYLEYLPFIVCFVDEFADLMTTSGKEAEILFARLAAKARAVGILLVLATQRPSADIITGLIKSNVPARIAFQVISLQDSRIILDQKGAEKLLGQGDMLYLSSTQPFPIRIQGGFLSKEEVDSICDHWKSTHEPKYINIAEFVGDSDEDDSEDFSYDGENKDPLFEQAVEIVYQTKKASASYLQRRLNIGYNRAARIVEQMEELGIVGPQRGAKAREVIGVV